MALIKILFSLVIATVAGVVVSAFLTPIIGLPVAMVTFYSLLKHC